MADLSSSKSIDSGKIAFVLSLFALILNLLQYLTSQEQSKISQEQNEIQRQQIAQNEKFQNEEIQMQNRPLVAFSKNARLPIRRGNDGTYSWEFPSSSTAVGEPSNDSLLVKNLGRGAAINTAITWMPSGGDFLDSAPEAPQLNADAQSIVESFPIQAFKEGKKTCVGCVELRFQDIDGHSHSSCQSFHAVLDESKYRVTVVFTGLARQEPIDWSADSPNFK